MSACKACSRRLSKELLSSTKLDGSPEDLCYRCLSNSYEEYNYLSDKEYVQGEVESIYYEPINIDY